MLNSLSARQIKPGQLTNEHFSPSALIDADKLNIDWAEKAVEILATRTVVDFVQVNGKDVPANSTSIVVAEITPPPATADSERGVVVQSGKNRVVIRTSGTGEPIIGASSKEVYGKVTRVSSDYVVTFYTTDGAGAEVAHEIEDATKIDFQYPQRFDLSTVTETFASNEKFVDGGADVSERLDITQIVKDVFGGSYTLDKDGQANNAKTIVEQLTEEVAARTSADEGLQDAIEAETTARVAAVNGIGTTLTPLNAEVVAARGSSASLVSELARIEAKADTAAGGGGISTYAEDKQVLTGDALIGTATYTLQSSEKYVAGNKSLQVFVNGMLQMEGVHYNEVEAAGAATGGTAVNFTPNLIEVNDVIQLRWTK